MRYFILFAIALVSLSSAADAARNNRYTKDENYSQAMPDVPLMDGFYEDTQNRDKKGNLDPNRMSGTVPGKDVQVKSYYDQQLREDGWKPAGPATPYTYVNKDGDTMTLDVKFLGNGKSSVVLTRQNKDGNAAPEAPAEDPYAGYAQSQNPQDYLPSPGQQPETGYESQYDAPAGEENDEEQGQ